MSTTVTVKASVSDMTPKVTNTEGIVIRTQGLAQAIDSRTSHVGVRIENRKRLRSELEGQRNATNRMNKKLEASTESTQNLSSLLQGVLDLQNVSKATPRNQRYLINRPCIKASASDGNSETPKRCSAAYSPTRCSSAS
jgi:hypothetical protein